MRTAVGAYCIAVAVLMAAWWTLDLVHGAWNRGDRSHAELALHLAGEFGTSAVLAAGAAALLSRAPFAAILAAAGLGMLLYTVTVSPGYFLARRETAAAGLFGVLAALTIAALIAVGFGV